MAMTPGSKTKAVKPQQADRPILIIGDSQNPVPPDRGRFKRSYPLIRSCIVAGAFLLLPLSARAGGVLTNCAEGSLRDAMADGGLVTFDCDGTITLASTITNWLDTVLDATGHQITISGGDTIRVFYVQSNVTFSVNYLTIAHGRSANGAGIFNDNGTVNATNTTFSGNEVLGAAGPNGWPGTAGGSGAGGAVANSGIINLENCSFTDNSAVGGAGTPTSYGGYAGYAGGSGVGGAIWNSGVLTGSGCTFAGNSAAGGIGGNGSTDPYGYTPHSGPGGPGGDGSGGALFNCGVARLVNCTLALNTGAGGAGGLGGPGYSGPPYPVPPGPNGSPGLGFGGIYDASGQCYLTNCTVAFNSGTGASNSRGGISTSGATMVNTLLAANSPGGNCLGAITDLGHNLSSDTTCAFTNAGSMNNTYPLIGPLTNNGGPTATIALLAGSRAIDAGDNLAAPPTDQRGVPRPFGIAADIGAYEYNSLTNPGPSSVVTECTEAALRVAMSGGGTVTFACEGTITLSNTLIITTNTMLDATDHHITISGLGVRLFYINTSVAFSVANLAIANGTAPSGGGILNAGGIVKATNCVFSGNCASISGGLARGGALQNESGDVSLSACRFIANQALGTAGANGLSGGSAWGGALDNSGTLMADLCLFIGNSARGAGGLAGSYYGTPGGAGGDGAGGAICNFGTMTILRSTLTNNSAVGGTGANGTWGYYGDPGMNGGDGSAGGSGGRGQGGAIYNAGTARVANTTFTFNSGVGANGGAGGPGGDSAQNHGGNGGGSGTGGDGTGAVFNLGDVEAINSTFAFNLGAGGNGTTSGAGGSGVFGGQGGSGGAGGSGFGAIYDQSICRITNCTFALNSGASGSSGAGGAGGYGSYQSGSPGAFGSPGSSGGGIGTTGGQLVNTLLAENTPGGNCRGYITDLGHNLSSDSSCAFTHVGSMNNTSPSLGPLADNGGPTLTMALLSGSPAIDAGDTTAAPMTDQRGFPRPAGAAPDIGAYEYGSVMPTLTISGSLEAGLNIIGAGNTGRVCRLLISADLSQWTSVATNQIGSDGTVLFNDNYGAGACRFYRLVMP